MVPVTPGHEIWQPGLLADATSKDPGLYQGPPIFGQESPATEPHQLAESVLELQQAMEPLTSFTNAEVLDNSPPSNWVKITSSRMGEPASGRSKNHSHRHSRTHRAWTRGSFAMTHGVGQSKPTATTWMASPSASPAPKVELQQGDTISPCQGLQIL